MSGTILPSLPPLADNHLVMVCIWCVKRCCLVQPHLRCPARMRSADAETVQLQVKVLRAGKAENETLDMPKCIEEVTELAATMRDRPYNADFEKAGMIPAVTFAGYRIEELGLDPEQCRDAIREVWPEVSEAIESARLALHA